MTRLTALICSQTAPMDRGSVVLTQCHRVKKIGFSRAKIAARSRCRFLSTEFERVTINFVFNPLIGQNVHQNSEH